MLRIAVFFACLGLSFAGFELTTWLSGQRIGACPEVAAKENFNLDQFMGTWYESHRTPVFYGNDLKCGKSVMSKQVKDNQVNVTMDNSGTNTEGELKASAGVTTIRDPTKPANWFLNYVRGGIMSFDVHYTVMDTDYTNYALMYTCVQVAPGISHYDIVYVLTRTRTAVAPAILDTLIKKATDAHIPDVVDRIQPQVQSGCVNN